jgi:proteic killer suppression protein
MRIRNVRHNHAGDRSGISQKLAVRIIDILAIIEAAPHVSRIATFPGLRLHQLRGGLEGYWSVSVSGNWRIVFRVEEDEIVDVDLVDYH